MAILRTGRLEVQFGGYSDEYRDEYAFYQNYTFLGLLHRGYYRYTQGEPFAPASSTFFYPADDNEELPAIWAAVTTVWANKETYASIADLKAAFDAALTTAGYTLVP